MTDRCPYCGATQEKPLFKKSDKADAVVQVECESCGRAIKVTLKIVENYDVRLPDDVSTKLTTVGLRVRKNPRWDWCICRADGRSRKAFKCYCKTGTFEVKQAEKSERAGSGFFVTVSNKNGLLGPIDSGYFLPAEEEACPVDNLPTGRS